MYMSSLQYGPITVCFNRSLLTTQPQSWAWMMWQAWRQMKPSSWCRCGRAWVHACTRHMYALLYVQGLSKAA